LDMPGIRPSARQTLGDSATAGERHQAERQTVAFTGREEANQDGTNLSADKKNLLLPGEENGSLKMRRGRETSRAGEEERGRYSPGTADVRGAGIDKGEDRGVEEVPAAWGGIGSRPQASRMRGPHYRKETKRRRWGLKKAYFPQEATTSKSRGKR